MPCPSRRVRAFRQVCEQSCLSAGRSSRVTTVRKWPCSDGGRATGIPFAPISKAGSPLLYQLELGGASPYAPSATNPSWSPLTVSICTPIVWAAPGARPAVCVTDRPALVACSVVAQLAARLLARCARFERRRMAGAQRGGRARRLGLRRACPRGLAYRLHEACA